MSIDQISLISAIAKELSKQKVKATIGQMNVIIEAANTIIRECERVPVMATEGMGLSAWLASDDTGMSSCYMASVLDGNFHRCYAHPLDLDDFGRCSRLLKAVPEFRNRLTRMSLKSPQWARLVERWTEIETLATTRPLEANQIIQDCQTIDP